MHYSSSGSLEPLQRGFARTFVYNEVVRKLRATFPSCTFFFVPGIKNPSDGISRGEKWNGNVDVIRRQTTEIINAKTTPTDQTQTATDGETGERLGEPEWSHTVAAPYRA